ncbi:MAG TPA: hypothetical protein VGZ22_27035 [Isosphaeraceae bacterium]|jgi:hypothetical protein|nr:hypothetical protein [Isosphaeraceae bacterium]
MNTTELLDQVRIASPCQASWAAMAGDDRVRFCGLCQKHVYNLSAMPADEAAVLIVEKEGQLCARLYRRRDGTVLTADCPVGARMSLRRRVRRLAACAVVGVAGLLSSGALTRTAAANTGLTPPPSGSGVTVQDWVDWALEMIGVRRQPQVLMGRPCAPNQKETLPPLAPIPPAATLAVPPPAEG